MLISIFLRLRLSWVEFFFFLYRRLSYCIGMRLGFFLGGVVKGFKGEFLNKGFKFVEMFKVVCEVEVRISRFVGR